MQQGIETINGHVNGTHTNGPSGEVRSDAAYDLAVDLEIILRNLDQLQCITFMLVDRLRSSRKKPEAALCQRIGKDIGTQVSGLRTVIEELEKQAAV